MKTIILEQPGLLCVGEKDEPEALAPGEALVRVHRVGVCGTDFHAFRGRQPFFTYPRILGHELGVEVVSVGPGVEDIRAGDRCAVEPYLNCGQCIACRRGKTNCCVDLKVLGVHVDGGMQSFIVVPAHKLHPSEKLSLEQLALVETLGIGAHAVARAHIQPREGVIVVGAGPIGLSVIEFARIAGAELTVLDVNEQRLRFCRDQLGVERTILTGANILEDLKRRGDLPTLVFDATGNSTSMMQSFNFVANGGRLVFVGLFQGEVTFSDPDFHRREMTLLSSRNSTAEDFKRIIQLMEVGRIDTAPWITHRTLSGNLPDELPRWLEPESGVIKGMVEF